MATDTLVSTQATLGSSAANTIALESLTGVAISAEKVKNGIRYTSFTFTDHTVTITDALSYFGEKIATFPAGVIGITGSYGSLTFTTTSTLASTLNASVTCAWGLGSAAASNVTLSSTMVNILPSVAFTSSATINVANTATNGFLAVPLNLDGHTTAVPIYFNIGIPTNTDIDGDATVKVNGTVVIGWMNHGDF